jgi:hypothetical protein
MQHEHEKRRGARREEKGERHARVLGVWGCSRMVSSFREAPATFTEGGDVCARSAKNVQASSMLGAKRKTPGGLRTGVSPARDRSHRSRQGVSMLHDQPTLPSPIPLNRRGESAHGHASTDRAERSTTGWSNTRCLSSVRGEAQRGHEPCLESRSE